MIKINQSTLIISLAVTLVAVFGLLLAARPGTASVTIAEVNLQADQATTLVSSDSQITISIPPDDAAPRLFASIVDIAKRNEITNFFEAPTGLSALTDAFIFRLKKPGDIEYTTTDKITVSLKYSSAAQMPQPYYYDWSNMRFALASSTYDQTSQAINFEVPLTSHGHVLFALFGQSEQIGTASWYVHPRYPTELMAASVDFPFGTKLKVTNPVNGKSVVVTVKDYGPDKSVHPDRVIDLSKVAFAQIASTSAGVIKVTVIPVSNE